MNDLPVNDLRCSEFVEHVTALLEGALGTDTEQRVLGHLPACPGCTRYLDQMRQTLRTLGGR